VDYIYLTLDTVDFKEWTLLTWLWIGWTLKSGLYSPGSG